jgi:REP element-mobilizing transposase RayT
LPRLQAAAEPDGVRILEHRLTNDKTSQFLVSTRPHIAPSACLRSVKGRLQYLVRDVVPKTFRRNYSIHSLGDAYRDIVEEYVAKQLQHHPRADARSESMLSPYQFVDEAVDFACTRRSSYGEFTLKT